MVHSLEIKRKVVHLFTGIFIALGYYFGFVSWQLLLAVIVAGFIVCHYAKTKFIPVVDWFLEHFDRKEDRRNFPGKGALTLVMGCFLAIVLFDKNTALAAMMILALGDSIGALLGPFGRIQNPLNKLKFVEGMVAGAIAGFVGAAIFVTWGQAFWASVIAMTVEGLDLKFQEMEMDDNILVPVVAGIVIKAMQAV